MNKAQFGEMRYLVNVNGAPALVDKQTLRQLDQNATIIEGHGYVTLCSVAEVAEAFEAGRITKSTAEALREVFSREHRPPRVLAK